MFYKGPQNNEVIPPRLERCWALMFLAGGGTMHSERVPPHQSSAGKLLCASVTEPSLLSLGLCSVQDSTVSILVYYVVS